MKIYAVFYESKFIKAFEDKNLAHAWAALQFTDPHLPNKKNEKNKENVEIRAFSDE